MIPRGLSLDQAPELSVTLRFLLTAPLFGLAAGALLAARGAEALTSRWSAEALGLTHLLVLGVIVMAMLGAMQQMLPVVAGARVPGALAVSGVVHVAWTAGVPCLVAGFLAWNTRALAAGAALLAAGGLTFLVTSAVALVRATSRLESVTAMRFALAGFALALALGVMMAAGRAGLPLPRSEALVNAHALVGLVGWVALLIIGVSWQVVPMLQVTPPYPAPLRRFTAPALFALLIARAGLGLVWPDAVALACIEALIAALLIAFALATLHVQSRRLRHVPDATLTLFRVAMISLLACLALAAAGRAGLVAAERATLMAALAGIVGFAISVVIGMVLKIVPFLAWFHLQALAARQAAEGKPLRAVPTMKDFLPDAAARWQVRAQFAATLACVLAPLAPAHLALPAGILLCASFATLFVVQARAVLRYREARAR